MFDNLGYYKENDVLIVDNHFNPIHSEFFGVETLPFEDYVSHNVRLSNITSDLISLFKKPRLLIFNFQENIPKDILVLLDILAKNGVKVQLLTFCLALKNYFDTKYPNHKIELPNIEAANHFHYTASSWKELLSPLSGDRKYDLIYFNASRKPFRDKVNTFLEDNNLIENNLVSIRSNSTLTKEEQIFGIKEIYRDYHTEKCFLDYTYERYEGYKNIHKSQENITPWGDQESQDYAQYEAHLNSKFNILCEAIYPYENSDYEIMKYMTSVSKRTMYPILFENVFHIYPKNKPLEEWLVTNGFQLFFENDEDFLKNLNDEFYYREDIQSKLKSNSKLMRSFFINLAYHKINGL